MPHSLTEQLADFLQRISIEQLPQSVIHMAKCCLIDYMAAVWNSSKHPASKSYRQVALELGGRGRAQIIGEGCSTPYWAAFANAALAHMMEVDDTHRKSSMHIGCVVFPVVLAMEAECNLSGKEMITATVCGYEAAARFGECFGPYHSTLFHSTATAGCFGAAAAAAKAMKLSAEETAWALGHAGAQAFALWQFLADGVIEAKPYHAGKAAQAGIISAQLAARGIRGPVHILEGEKGYCARIVSNPDLDAVVNRFAQPYKIEETCFKKYPTCGQIHAPLGALREILRRTNISVDDIREIRVYLYRQALNLTDNPTPIDMSGACFSLQRCLALMIVKGDLNFENMTYNNIFDDEKVVQLSKKVNVLHDPELEKGFPEGRPCRVEVHLNNNTVLAAQRKFREGDPECPLSRSELEDKFRQLSAHVLSHHVQTRILEQCWHMGGETPFTDIIYTGSEK